MIHHLCNGQSATILFDRLFKAVAIVGPKWAKIASIVALGAFPLAAFQPNASAGSFAFPQSQAVCAAVEHGGVSGDRLRLLSRGFNVSGWLDRDAPRRPDLGLLAKLRALGFTHIRLPVDGEALMPAYAGKEKIAERLRETSLAVELLLTLGYAVIVDMHPGGAFSKLHVSDPDRAYMQLETAWRSLAGRFASSDPDRVFFELLNEPDASAAVWEAQAKRLAVFVRQLAPEHTLIIGPSGAQDVAALRTFEPLDMPNVVYSVHFYLPMEFTHQGLDWSEGSPLAALHAVPYPLRKGEAKADAVLADLAKDNKPDAAARLGDAMEEGWDDEKVAAALAPAADWALRYRKPVTIGEFGVLARYASIEDRAAWLRAVRKTAESYCFGWTHWEFDAGFGFLDATGTAIEPALEHALLGK